MGCEIAESPLCIFTHSSRGYNLNGFSITGFRPFLIISLNSLVKRIGITCHSSSNRWLSYYLGLYRNNKFHVWGSI